MIRCRACGHANDRGSAFCGSCGIFLEWTAEAEEAPPPPAEVDTGVFFRTDYAVGGSGHVVRHAPDVPAVAPEDDEPSPTEDLGSRAEAGTVPPPPVRTGPPKPPPAGTRVDRPPPMSDGTRPDGWAPPARRSDDDDTTSPDVLRVLARPLTDDGDGNGTAVGGTTRRLRRVPGVEVQPTAADEDEEAPRPEEPTFGPSLPGRQHDFARAPTVRLPPTRTPQPGDVICERCGESNLSSRSFCRRCGLELAAVVDADAPVRAVWWRRLLPRRRRREQQRYRAGQRPAVDRTAAGQSRSRRAWRRVTKVGRVGFSYLLAVLAILALLGTVLPQAAPIRTRIVTTLETTGQKVQRFLVPQYARVNPIALVASSALPEHPGENVVDGFSNTFWTEGAPGPGVGESVTVTFQEPVDLALIAVLNGGVPEGVEYISRPRPRLIQLQFDDGTLIDVELRDEADVQEHRIEAPVTTTFTVRILSVYESTSGSEDTSISEIEFLRRL